MELWFIYTLLSALFAGLFTFGLKVIAEKDLKANLLTAVYFAVAANLAFLAWVITGGDTHDIESALLLGGLSGALTSLLYLIQVQGLKYIDAAIFYPIYKTLGPLLVIIVGVVYFAEELTKFEYIALALSLFIPLLLVSRGEKGRQKNLCRGFIILGICGLLTTVTVILSKFAIDRSIDVYFYLMIQMISGLGANILIGIMRREPVMIKHMTKQYLGYGAILGSFMFGFIVLYLLAIQDGLLSIVYTVQSFYILIPIVLAVIIYKEHMNVQKAIAIVLSILAIIFFQV